MNQLPSIAPDRVLLCNYSLMVPSVLPAMRAGSAHLSGQNTGFLGRTEIFLEEVAFEGNYSKELGYVRR